MPLTAKGEEIKRAMTEEYGAKKGEQVFYASANKGTISGVHDALAGLPGALTPEQVRQRSTRNDPFRP